MRERRYEIGRGEPRRSLRRTPAAGETAVTGGNRVVYGLCFIWSTMQCHSWLAAGEFGIVVDFHGPIAYKLSGVAAPTMRNWPSCSLLLTTNLVRETTKKRHLKPP
ncbi:hypothetical protein SDJN03_15084, partial [Cucurbita argyrosperma subsp. sororia]